MLFKGGRVRQPLASRIGTRNFLSIHEKYVQILHPFGNIEDKFH